MKDLKSASDLKTESSDEQAVETREESIWGPTFSRTEVFARNISMDYIALGIEMLIGVLMLPFNVSHLGQSAYGLWVLVASITMYFSMLDLGYGVAQVKFAAEYRARKDSRGLNEIISTLFFFFSLTGLAAFALGAFAAFNLEAFFNVTAEQAVTGRKVLLIITAFVALGFPFSVFGGVVNGFQRHFMNGYISISASVAAAIANVVVLLAGYGLVELVAVTTGIRMLAYLGYRLNAYRAYPGLKIRARYIRLSRLGEATSFSTFILLIDLANKVNYSTDTLVIGVFMSTAAIAIWSVAQRLITTTQNLTIQLNGSLFPIIVDIATLGESDKLRYVFTQGTRLSLAMVIPVAMGLVLLADPLILAWVGPDFSASVPLIYALAAAVIIRVGNSTATTVLKGAGHHRLLATANLLTAASNLALSIALVRKYGLMGVAMGTLIPLAAISIFVLFPAACRRVGMSVTKAIRQAVWPAVWPVIPMSVLLALTRNLAGASLPFILVQSVGAGALYALLFLWLAVGREERAWYFNKIKRLLGGRWAAATA